MIGKKLILSGRSFVAAGLIFMAQELGFISSLTPVFAGVLQRA